jgi:hypothetical protein
MLSFGTYSWVTQLKKLLHGFSGKDTLHQDQTPAQKLLIFCSCRGAGRRRLSSELVRFSRGREGATPLRRKTPSGGSFQALPSDDQSTSLFGFVAKIIMEPEARVCSLAVQLTRPLQRVWRCTSPGKHSPLLALPSLAPFGLLGPSRRFTTVSTHTKLGTLDSPASPSMKETMISRKTTSSLVSYESALFQGSCC